MFRRALALLCAVLLSIVLAPAAAMAAPTEGSGGALTNRLNQSFSANGITSKYHIFAAGLDWSKPVGLLLYTDGSGGYGLDNPNSTYLLDADGSAGLVAVAKKHNLLLLTPFAPSPSCDGTDNCWYNTTGTPAAPAKADWARALVNHVYGQYSIDKDRVAIGGYSSGAQFTTGWFVPRHGAAVQTDGVIVPIAYGRAPAVANTFTAQYKANVAGHWNTGTADAAYSTSSWGARGGHSWYTANGFRTTAEWPAGVGHGRSGEFARIMDAQIAAHVPAGTAAAPKLMAGDRNGDSRVNLADLRALSASRPADTELAQIVANWTN
jgi:poly(3-hydroxybutyrate) depolymerase